MTPKQYRDESIYNNKEKKKDDSAMYQKQYIFKSISSE